MEREMVTFYRPTSKEAREQLASVVWNPKANAALADFSLAGGKFETDDPMVIARLRELGYPEVERPSVPQKGKAPSPAVKTKLKSRKSTTSPKPDEMDSDISPR